MNRSDTHRMLWMAPQRTGTRSVIEILKHMDFHPPQKHDLGFPSGTEDWKLLVSTRNPYTRAVSMWKWLAPASTFRDWALGTLRKPPWWMNYENALAGRSYCLIRMEHMAADLSAVTEIAEELKTNRGLRVSLRNNGETNQFRTGGPDCQVYDDETAAIVLDRFRRQFELFGYSTDLWRVQ